MYEKLQAGRSIPSATYGGAASAEADRILFLDEMSKEVEIANSDLRNCIEGARSLADSIFGAEPPTPETAAAGTPAGPGRAYSFKAQVSGTRQLILELRHQIDRLSI